MKIVRIVIMKMSLNPSNFYLFEQYNYDYKNYNWKKLYDYIETMLNIYLIYVSSLETGDVNIIDRVFTNFSKAVDNLDYTMEKYIKDRNAEKTSRIVLKDKFSEKDLRKDSTFIVDSYCFKKKKSSVWIYKKVIDEGRLWNAHKIERIGKIGILSEIHIPIDKKLLRLFDDIRSDMLDQIAGNTCEDFSEESEESEDDTDEYNITMPNPSNYEHGQHVNFIYELKQKLHNRRNSIDLGRLKHLENKEFTNFTNENFILSLNETKKSLTNITSPSSPKLGRIIDFTLYEEPLFEISSDLSESSEIINNMNDDMDEDDMDEDDMDEDDIEEDDINEDDINKDNMDIDESFEIVNNINDIDDNIYIDESSEIINNINDIDEDNMDMDESSEINYPIITPYIPEERYEGDEYVDKHILTIVDNIMNTINLNDRYIPEDTVSDEEYEVDSSDMESNIESDTEEYEVDSSDMESNIESDFEDIYEYFSEGSEPKRKFKYKTYYSV